MVVATTTVETATTSRAPVVEWATFSGATGGTVRAGGAITGGRVWADDPPLDDGDGADADAGGDEPGACGTVGAAGCDVCRGGCEGAGFLGGVVAGAGFGVTGAGPLQQWPSPWCSCDHPERQWSPGRPDCVEAPGPPMVSAAATVTSIQPKSMRRIDALASIIKRTRLIGKSPPGRSYGRARWDL